VIGDPLLKLSRLMGHAGIESTCIYLDHLAEAERSWTRRDAFDLGLTTREERQ
jgi:hypothetical protein